MRVLIVASIVVVFAATKQTNNNVARDPLEEPDDVSDEAHIFSTYTLPTNERFMPSIGNGHIAANIFNDTVYMNGLYNGINGSSHRARIPNWANIRLSSTLTNHTYSSVYSLDTKEGVFKVRVDRDRSVVTQRVYAHRYYTRAIINQIQVVAKRHADPNCIHKELLIALKLMPGAISKDISFYYPRPEFIQNRNVWTTCGQTVQSEDEVYQPLPVDVCVYWTMVPEHLVVPEYGSRDFTFVMTADKNKTVARNELIKVLQEDGEELFNKHLDHWSKSYQQASMEIEGNLKLAKIVNGIWYYFLSSLPSEHSYHPLGRYYGLSPGGLARGALSEDYQGHNFWDTETWMFPSILLLYPQYAQKLLQYRLDTAYVAKERANITGHKGYRFPWESAYTGVEVTQSCCPEVAEFEQHISGCIAFAARQFLATTRSEEWLENGGCTLVTQIADFWASRAVRNYSTGLYDIQNVMGPDEDHSNITNSAFTNVIAGYSLYLAQYVSCLCKSDFTTRDPEHYADIAWSLALPYDNRYDYHPEFSGYKREEIIKQADVVLLGYPLQYSMNLSTKANDLSYYENVTRSDGPAMTWSMHAIGHLQLGEEQKAEANFIKSYTYTREPFKVWSEQARPNIGAVNFLTGMGGFLQTLIFGYAGVSIHLDKLMIDKPRLPPGSTRFKIRGIKYIGTNFTLEIDEESTTLKVSSVDYNWPLTMFNGKIYVNLVPGLTVNLSGKGPFSIKANLWKDCKIPADVIGNPIHHPMCA